MEEGPTHIYPVIPTIRSAFPSLFSLISAGHGGLPGGVTQTSFLEGPDPPPSLGLLEGLFTAPLAQRYQEHPRGSLGSA